MFTIIIPCVLVFAGLMFILGEVKMSPDQFIEDCKQLEQFAKTIKVNTKSDQMRLDYILAEYRSSVFALAQALKKEREKLI